MYRDLIDPAYAAPRPDADFMLLDQSAATQILDGSGDMTVLHLDLDAFTKVNDSLGHAAGDELIQVVAKRLSHFFAGEEVTIARVGGDEFVIVLVNKPTTTEVYAMAGKINEVLDEPHYIGEHDQGITSVEPHDA